jgi:uncharacterized protein YcnI
MLRRVAAVVVAAPLAVLVSALPAAAHVTVHSYEAVRGGSDAVLSFRTPNERDNATTTKLQVFLPTTTPLLGVLVQPLQGWSFAVKNITLKKPVQTDDGPITEAVSEVTWSGGHIPVGGYQDFNIDVSDLPNVPSLTFKALQTYSNGTVVRWIETAPPGAPEPDYPAPTLALKSATTVPSPFAGVRSSASNTTDRVLSIAALGLAALAAIVAGFALLRRWEAGDPT